MRASLFGMGLLIATSVAPGAVWAQAPGQGAPPAQGLNRSLPQTVEFTGLDGTKLIGYLYQPQITRGAKTPAIVMMHGRSGPYSTRARGQYDARTLSMRHRFWGEYWASQGYTALLIDSFGPRGYPQGFPRFSYRDRPDELNEVTVRPLDAYGALRYLRSIPCVDGVHIALQGWSNGGSATIATLSDETLRSAGLKTGEGFVGGLAFYPACGLHNKFAQRYMPYAPIRVFSGDADEEVSSERCAKLIAASRAIGGQAAIDVFPGATHSFDDPGKKRQSEPANYSATQIAVPTGAAFMRMVFATKP